MKFLYEYRTSDNIRHEGVVAAANRDAAFAALKARGIKPSRLAEAPGFFSIVFSARASAGSQSPSSPSSV